MFLASIPAGAGTQPNHVYASSYPGIDSTGLTDSRAALNGLMQILANTGKTLVIDCPIKLSITNNVNAPIFVPSFLNVDFTAAGRIIVDNILIPAFCFLHTTDCTWTRPQIRYVGTLPLDANPDTGAANYAYFGAWNNVVTAMLSLPVSQGGFGNTFTNGATAFSSGANGMAVFSFRGQCARLTFNNLLMDVPALKVDGVTPTLCTNFIPIAISIYPEWTPGVTISNTNTQQTAANTVVPLQIHFNQPIFDGYLSGVVGAGGFEMNEPVFKRYSDLQDASYVTNGTGANWGGGGSSTWFPSPHCLSIQSIVTGTAADAAALTQTKIINNGYDFGLYVGGTTRRNASSGSMCAIKCSPDGGTRINGFKTVRPDGLIDIVAANISPPGSCELNDLECSAYNSTIVHADNGTFPAVRFLNLISGAGFSNLTINRMSVNDVAVKPSTWAIQGVGLASDINVAIYNLKYYLNDMPANGSWGVNTQGANMTLTGDVYLANCTNTSTYKGLIANTSSNLTDSLYDLQIWGWRIINSLTFSAAPSGSSATLSTNWLFPTDQYVITFPSGQQRLVTLTLNSNTATWSPALPAAEANATFVVNCITSGNINSYRNNIQLDGGVLGAYVKVKDMSNGITQECDDGVITETWSQYYSGSPVGTSQATTMSFPSTFAIDRVGCAVITTMGTVASFGIGWTSSSTALLATQSTSSSGNAAIPLDNTWPKSLGGSARNILLTPTSGTFDGTGVLELTVRGKRMYGSG